MSQSEIGTSRSHWFLRGLGAGILLMAAVNAASYFGRSDGLGDLYGPSHRYAEAIGFPLEMWREGNAYGGYFVSYPALGLNALCALACGSVLGLLAVSRMSQLNTWIADVEQQITHRENRKFQFTLFGLMAGTALTAVAASVARTLSPRPEALGAIYWCGPTALIILALIPYRISWEHRVAILVTAAVVFIAVAIAIGTALKMEFDKVLLGIFLCWTPQSMLLALLVMTGTLVGYYRRSIRT